MKTLRSALPRLRHEKTELERTTIFNGFTASLRDFVTGYATAKEAITTNKDLSEGGQKKELAKLDASFVQAFNVFPERLGLIKTQFKAEADANYRHAPYRKGSNELLDYLLGREIRDHLNSLPLGEKVRLLLDPTADPTGQYLHYAETSPVPMPGIDSEIISRAHQERAIALNPAGVLAVEDQTIVLEALGHNINEVRKLLGIVPAGTPEDLPAE